MEKINILKSIQFIIEKLDFVQFFIMKGFVTKKQPVQNELLAYLCVNPFRMTSKTAIFRIAQFKQKIFLVFF